MKKIKSIFIIFVLISSMALAIDGVFANDNTVESSTIYFEGVLTRNADGSYSGTIPAIPGNYYVPGGPGAGISTGGGFDLFAKEGGRAYVDDYYGTGPWNYGGTDTFRIGYFGDSHDAYLSETGGGPWGSFYDPDVPDYYHYQLTLKDNQWYLEFNNNALGTPMSGNVDWSRMYAYEIDIGSYRGIATPKYPGRAAANGGGIQAWDMDWTWGSEVIPLEYPGFKIAVTPAADGKYLVSLTPAENPVKKSLPIDKFLKILQKNKCKNHPDLEGCDVIN